MGEETSRPVPTFLSCPTFPLSPVPSMLELRRWQKRWESSAWSAFLAEPESDAELGRLRRSTHSGRPLGTPQIVAVAHSFAFCVSSLMTSFTLLALARPARREPGWRGGGFSRAYGTLDRICNFPGAEAPGYWQSPATRALICGGAERHGCPFKAGKRGDTGNGAKHGGKRGGKRRAGTGRFLSYSLFAEWHCCKLTRHRPDFPAC